MLDISCPGVYPGVLLWPICHPYMKALAPSRVENAPLTARLSLLFFFFRVDSDRHFSESMVLASLSPPSLGVAHSLGDPLLSRSSVCSSFRPVSDIFAHCLSLCCCQHFPGPSQNSLLERRQAKPAKLGVLCDYVGIVVLAPKMQAGIDA